MSQHKSGSQHKSVSQHTTDINASATAETLIKLSPACSCAACQHGCRFGSGVLADHDVRNIARHLRITEKELKETYLEETERFNTRRWRPRLQGKEGKPYGRCVFFDEKAKCTIHPVKPLECRISSGCRPHAELASVWFTFNHFVNKDNAESLRQWHVHQQLMEKQGTFLKGTRLSDIVPDTKERENIVGYSDLQKKQLHDARQLHDAKQRRN